MQLLLDAITDLLTLITAASVIYPEGYIYVLSVVLTPIMNVVAVVNAQLIVSKIAKKVYAYLTRKRK